MLAGVDLFIRRRSSRVIIGPSSGVGVLLDFDDLLVILLLGESFPSPEEDAIDGVADPALWFARTRFEPSVIRGDVDASERASCRNSLALGERDVVPVNTKKKCEGAWDNIYFTTRYFLSRTFLIS